MVDSFRTRSKILNRHFFNSDFPVLFNSQPFTLLKKLFTHKVTDNAGVRIKIMKVLNF